jgi:polynucleotide 5'-hydroxyl-kinase GRC3/NOL9
MEIVPGKGWEEIVAGLAKSGGTALLLGGVDTGKSTLARYLAAALTVAGKPVALVDADIGQSSLGLPGTVCMKTFRAPADLGEYRPARLAFVGEVSPARIIGLHVAETIRMVRHARAEAGIVVIDTTGLVSGDMGRALKLEKIRGVAPDLIIAIQRSDELSPILDRCSGIPATSLPPSSLARRRSPEARSRYRQEKLRAYFARTREFFLSAHDLHCLHRGRPISLRGIRLPAGTVLGLNRDAETRALGLVTESDEESLVIRSPLSALSGLNRVIIGSFEA